MTKKELLAQAKAYQITGRHEMTVDQLRKAIDAFERVQRISKERVKDVMRRYPSLHKRDGSGRVIRRGKNLSGNIPFKRKFYYLNPALADESRWTPAYREAFMAAPRQVQGLLRYMAEYVTDKHNPKQGPEIADMAKFEHVKSKIDSDKLFAYYRHALEVLGVIHVAGYGFDEEEGEEAEEAEEAEEMGETV